jgi:hypothetical protein
VRSAFSGRMTSVRRQSSMVLDCPNACGLASTELKASSTPKTGKKNLENPGIETIMGSSLKAGEWQLATVVVILLDGTTRRNDSIFCIVSGFPEAALRPLMDCA